MSTTNSLCCSWRSSINIMDDALSSSSLSDMPEDDFVVPSDANVFHDSDEEAQNENMKVREEQ